jgi:multiple sugar transport system permease protein
MKSDIRALLVNLAILVVIVWILFPLFWALISSLKSNSDVFQYPPPVIFKPVLDAYAVVLSSKWLTYFQNSIIASVGATCVAMAVGLPAAYALARLDPPRKNFTMLNILSIRMMPPAVMILPYFLMFFYLKLIDNLISLVLTYATFGIPYVVWIMKGFIEQVPKEAEEAARLDGANTLRILTRIVLPLTKAGVVVSAFFAFVQGWNDVLFSTILTTFNTTVPVGVTTLISERSVAWNQVFAVGVVNILPAIVIAYLIRNYWARGLTLGIVKG